MLVSVFENLIDHNWCTDRITVIKCPNRFIWRVHTTVRAVIEVNIAAIAMRLPRRIVQTDHIAHKRYPEADGRCIIRSDQDGWRLFEGLDVEQPSRSGVIGRWFAGDDWSRNEHRFAFISPNALVTQTYDDIAGADVVIDS